MTGAGVGAGTRLEPSSRQWSGQETPACPGVIHDHDVQDEDVMEVDEVTVYGSAVRRLLPAGLPQRCPALPSVPAGVTDRLLWRMGERLRRDHLPGRDGRCVCCEMAFPCLGSRLGEAGVRLAETGSQRPPPVEPQVVLRV